MSGSGTETTRPVRRMFDRGGFCLITGLRVTTPLGQGLVTEFDIDDGYVLVHLDAGETVEFHPHELHTVVRRVEALIEAVG